MDSGGCELQQVGKDSPFQIVPKVLRNINQFYVLHKVVLQRLIFFLLSIALVFFLFQTREEISKIYTNFTAIISEQLVLIGFGISEVQINGHVLSTEQQILNALELNEKSSTVTFDAKEARLRLLALPAISEVSVRKSFPKQIIIDIIEVEPVARWNVGGETFYIDKAGKKLALKTNGGNEDLPLIIGQGAADDAFILINALKQYEAINEDLVALSRIADRRWDLIYKNGLRVQLPEFGMEQALRQLEDYQIEYSIFDKDISIIDLRISNSIAVRLNKRENISAD